MSFRVTGVGLVPATDLILHSVERNIFWRYGRREIILRGDKECLGLITTSEMMDSLRNSAQAIGVEASSKPNPNSLSCQNVVEMTKCNVQLEAADLRLVIETFTGEHYTAVLSRELLADLIALLKHNLPEKSAASANSSRKFANSGGLVRRIEKPDSAPEIIPSDSPLPVSAPAPRLKGVMQKFFKTDTWKEYVENLAKNWSGANSLSLREKEILLIKTLQGAYGYYLETARESVTEKGNHEHLDLVLLSHIASGYRLLALSINRSDIDPAQAKALIFALGEAALQLKQYPSLSPRVVLPGEVPKESAWHESENYVNNWQKLKKPKNANLALERILSLIIALSLPTISILWSANPTKSQRNVILAIWFLGGEYREMAVPGVAWTMLHAQARIAAEEVLKDLLKNVNVSQLLESSKPS